MKLAKRRMDSIKDILEGGNRAKDISAENRDFNQSLPACGGIINDGNVWAPLSVTFKYQKRNGFTVQRFK